MKIRWVKTKVMKKTTIETFEKDVLLCEKPTVVLFSNNGCPLCSSLQPICERLEKKYFNSLKFFKVDTFDQKELSEPFLDGGVPTIQIFSDMYPPVLLPYPEHPDPITGYGKEYLDTWLFHYLLSYKMMKDAENARKEEQHSE